MSERRQIDFGSVTENEIDTPRKVSSMSVGAAILNTSRQDLKERMAELEARIASGQHGRKIHTSKIKTWQFNRFKSAFGPDDKSFASFVESIEKTGGNIVPGLLRTIPNTDEYQIIYGERRFRACEMLGLEYNAVVLDELDDESAIFMRDMENQSRKNKSFVERALTIANTGFDGEFVKAIAERSGMSDRQIKKFRAINRVPVDVWVRVAPELHTSYAKAMPVVRLYEERQSEFLDLLERNEGPIDVVKAMAPQQDAPTGARAGLKVLTFKGKMASFVIDDIANASDEAMSELDRRIYEVIQQWADSLSAVETPTRD